MVTHDHMNIGTAHDVLKDLNAKGVPVNHVTQYIERIIRKLDQFQHGLPPENFSVNIRHAVNHAFPSFLVNKDLRCIVAFLFVRVYWSAWYQRAGRTVERGQMPHIGLRNCRGGQ